MTVGICNSSEILSSNTFSTSTGFSLSWNGKLQKSELNTDYCFTISPISNNVTATPINIEFKLVQSAVVFDYSSISVPNKVMFETDNLLVVVDLRDQWNNTIESSIYVIDQDGNVVGLANIGLKYNATLLPGQFGSIRTLYLGRLNETYPHVSFYGTFFIMN